MLALSGLSAAYYYATALGGGETGIDTGFGGASAFVLTALPASGTWVLQGRYPSAVAGWQHVVTNTSGVVTVQSIMVSGAGGLITGPQRVVTPADLGRVLVSAFQHTGAGSQVRHYMDRIEVGTPVAIVGFTAPSASTRHTLGSQDAVAPLGGHILGVMTWRGVPTLGQLQSSLFDATRLAGDLPKTVDGVTVTHRWSLKDTLTGQAVTDGQVAPATLADTVTGASVDAQARTGTPAVREIDVVTLNGRKSYGIIGAGTGNRYETAASTGLVGQAAGFSVAVRATIDSLTTSKGYLLVQNTGSSEGWYLGVANAGPGTLRFVCAGTSGMVAATVTLTLADIGTDLLIEGEHDGAALRLRINGQERATAAITGYAHLSTARTAIGGYIVNDWPLEGVTVKQAATGNGSLTTTERALFAANFASTGRLIPIAGKHEHHWDLDADIATAGPSSGAPATTTDRVGTASMSRAGTGLTVSRRTERAFSYETTPVLRGVRGLSLANYLSVAGGLATSATTYWLILALQIHAKAGGSFQNILSKATTNSQSGIGLYGSSNLGTLNFTHGTGSAVVSAPTVSVADAELGMTLLLGYVYTGSVLQAYARRARNGSNATATVFTPYSGAMMVGRHADTTSNPGSDNFTVLGLMGGTTPITQAEYFAAYDAFVSEEDLLEVPGKTTRLWSVKRAQNGTLLPVPDAQGSGEVLALNGAPTLSNIYGRAIAA